MKYEERKVRNEIIANLFETGMSQSDIGKIVNLGQRMISTLFTKLSQKQPLTSKSPGGQSRLSEIELSKLPNLLEKGSESYGFSGDYWTHARVGYVINQEFNVQYEDKQVGRILALINWTRQKPQKKDAQQSAAKVEKWQKEDLPALKKSDRRRL
jgi:transposase